MTGGGGRRTQRWPEIWPDHRLQLMTAAHRTFKACVSPMVSLRPESSDYGAVDRLQASCLAFSTEISGGQSWVQGFTTSAPFVPSGVDDRESEIDTVLAECYGDHRVAIRVLLDIRDRVQHDHEGLLLQM